jgi:hypothetical protein
VYGSGRAESHLKEANMAKTSKRPATGRPIIINTGESGSTSFFSFLAAIFG